MFNQIIYVFNVYYRDNHAKFLFCFGNFPKKNLVFSVEFKGGLFNYPVLLGFGFVFFWVGLDLSLLFSIVLVVLSFHIWLFILPRVVSLLYIPIVKPFYVLYQPELLWDEEVSAGDTRSRQRRSLMTVSSGVDWGLTVLSLEGRP